MAVRPVVRTEAGGRVYRYTWSGVAAGDTGEPVKIPGASDRTVQAFGTWDGGSLGIDVSLEETVSTWFPATDQAGTEIAVTSNDGAFVTENGVWFRPNMTGGSGDSITVILTCRGTMR